MPALRGPLAHRRATLLAGACIAVAALGGATSATAATAVNQAVGTGPFAASDCSAVYDYEAADVRFCMRHVGSVATGGFQYTLPSDVFGSSSFRWRIQGHAPGAANQVFETFSASNVGEPGTTVTVWADRTGVASTVCAQTSSEYEELSPARTGDGRSC